MADRVSRWAFMGSRITTGHNTIPVLLLRGRFALSQLAVLAQHEVPIFSTFHSYKIPDLTPPRSQGGDMPYHVIHANIGLL
jgi:hypothetical protein